MNEELTDEEKDLLKRLSKSPKCMHPLDKMEEKLFVWKCHKCGMMAKKITKEYL